MQPSPVKLSARAIKTSWWLGTASLAIGLFITITSELLEHEASGVDRTILIGFAKARTSWLTVMAVDLNGIGVGHTRGAYDRPRPEVVPQLIQVSGWSYPSGHSLAAASLYLTVAILVCRHLQRTGHQIAFLAMTVGIILLVGTSRRYLGLHYPSIAIGISLGAGWALLLAGCFSFLPDPKVARRGQ